MAKKQPQYPSVFIAYSHDGKLHEQWVVKLAQALRKRGFKVSFDQDNQGKPVPEYSQESCLKTAKVIVVCTPKYKRKVDAKKGTVWHEARYLSERLRKSSASSFLVPVFRNVPKVGKRREPDRDQVKPGFLDFGPRYVDFSDDRKFAEHLDELANQLLDSVQPAMPTRQASTKGKVAKLPQIAAAPPVRPLKPLPAHEHELGVLFFADIVNFSGLPHDTRIRVVYDLGAFFTPKRAKQFRLHRSFGLLDGVGAVWRSGQGHAQALKLAAALHTWLKTEWPGVGLRIGLHVGQAMRFKGGNHADHSWFGTGCNDCRRIAQIGGAGHTLISEAFREGCRGEAEADQLLRHRLHPAPKERAYELFPNRGPSGHVRFYSDHPASIQPTPKLLELDYAAKSIARIQRQIGMVFQDLMREKWTIDPAKADLRITLWAPDPAMPDDLRCTDYRWLVAQNKEDAPSTTVYSLAGEGEGPPGRALRRAFRQPHAIPWLPQVGRKDPAALAIYQNLLEKLCGTKSATVNNASRHARAFVCLPFWSPGAAGLVDAGGPIGGLCLDSMEPLVPDPDNAEAVARVEREVVQFYSSLEAKALDDLAFAWLVRT